MEMLITDAGFDFINESVIQSLMIWILKEMKLNFRVKQNDIINSE